MNKHYQAGYRKGILGRGPAYAKGTASTSLWGRWGRCGHRDAAVTGMRGVDAKVGGCVAGEGGLCPTDHGEVGMLPHRLQQTVPPKQKPLLVERNFLGQLQNLNKNAMLKKKTKKKTGSQTSLLRALCPSPAHRPVCNSQGQFGVVGGGVSRGAGDQAPLSPPLLR